MALDENLSLRLVAKLIADTRDRRVLWKSVDPLLDSPADEQNRLSALMAPRILEQAKSVATYLSKVGDRAFRLDEYKLDGALFQMFSNGRTRRLSIAKPDGKVLKVIAESPNAGLSDLMAAVDDQLAQIDEFIDDYMRDSPAS